MNHRRAGKCLPQCPASGCCPWGCSISCRVAPCLRTWGCDGEPPARCNRRQLAPHSLGICTSWEEDEACKRGAFTHICVWVQIWARPAAQTLARAVLCFCSLCSSNPAFCPSVPAPSQQLGCPVRLCHAPSPGPCPPSSASPIISRQATPSHTHSLTAKLWGFFGSVDISPLCAGD